MPVTRTIYTQGEVRLTTGHFGETQVPFAVVSGVQNASVSFNSPRQNVNSFGVRGIIDKVQVEAETATTTFSYILPSGTGYGNHLSPSKVNSLMQNSLLDTPTGINISVAGIGCVYSGILSSLTINAAVGDLATCEMTFEGIPSGGYAAQDKDNELPAKISPVSEQTYGVLTPANISGVLAGVDGAGNFGGCAQSASFSWEIPVERVVCLGEPVSSASTFTTPPGTASVTAEGLDMPSGITGVIVGGFKFAIGTSSREVSREHSLAVGDVGATFNVTVEGTADSAICSVS